VAGWCSTRSAAFQCALCALALQCVGLLGMWLMADFPCSAILALKKYSGQVSIFGASKALLLSGKRKICKFSRAVGGFDATESIITFEGNKLCCLLWLKWLAASGSVRPPPERLYGKCPRLISDGARAILWRPYWSSPTLAQSPRPLRV
jgi:hypothetical protein